MASVRRRLGVAFLQSQSFFGADSAVHAQLMRHLDRREVTVHCACTGQRQADPRVSSLEHVRSIPDVRLRVTDFGPTLFGLSRAQRVKGLVTGARAAVRAASLVRYLRAESIDILHGTEKPRDAFLGTLLARASGASMVIHMHVGFDDWISPRVRWAIGRADAVIGISSFVSAGLVRAGYDPDRIFTVPNSLDLDDGRYVARRDRREVRRELAIAEDAPVVCIASRIFRWKGHDDLVEAFARVRARRPDARLVIVGEHDPRADPGAETYRAQLDARIARLGLRSSVVFTGFRTDVADLMAASDVFCQPSAAEPFGMVYLEAMALRRPVVAYRSGGAPEVILDGETGLLVAPKDINGLAASLISLLSDETLRRRMGEAGRARVASVFSPASSAAAVLDVYRAVVARRNRSVIARGPWLAAEHGAPRR